ncbi:hypothetical protein [Micromonospora sp. RTGN7]|uniref:hypothetical protein n=1 Tax=Micromonospora sp. RTGN7 TaxID=3016526 RepID=UPI0029FF3B1C|nr:hypothetical protein [Micromonospora sp. RTGN7]
MPQLARHALSAVAVTGLLAAAAGIAAPAAAAPAAAPPTTPCVVETLPGPAGLASEAWNTDPTGRFVIGSTMRDTGHGTEYVVLRWDQGQLVTTLPLSFVGGAVDVNAHGVMVGDGQTDGSSRPWVYRNGTFIDLPKPANSKLTFVSAINRAGDIVGYAYHDGTYEASALLWPAARPGTVEKLRGVPADVLTQDITLDGTIVGFTRELETAPRTSWVRWPDGRSAPLTVPNGRWAQVVAAQGRWAVGTVDTVDGDYFPVRWDLGTGGYIRLHPNALGATDINSRGTALSGSLVIRGNTYRSLPAPAGAQTAAGRAIANDGSIVGFSNTNGWLSAVRWTGC